MKFEGATPTPRCRHSATLIESEMIIFGGNDCDRSYNDLYSLDIDYLCIKQIKIQNSEFFANLKELLHNQDFSDVVFIIKGEKIKAHRAILSVRCE